MVGVVPSIVGVVPRVLGLALWLLPSVFSLRAYAGNWYARTERKRKKETHALCPMYIREYKRMDHFFLITSLFVLLISNIFTDPPCGLPGVADPRICTTHPYMLPSP